MKKLFINCTLALMILCIVILFSMIIFVAVKAWAQDHGCYDVRLPGDNPAPYTRNDIFRADKSTLREAVTDKPCRWEYRMFNLFEIFMDEKVKVASEIAKAQGKSGWSLPPMGPNNMSGEKKVSIINGLIGQGWEPHGEYTGGDFIWLKRGRPDWPRGEIR